MHTTTNPINPSALLCLLYLLISHHKKNNPEQAQLKPEASPKTGLPPDSCNGYCEGSGLLMHGEALAESLPFSPGFTPTSGPAALLAASAVLDPLVQSFLMEREGNVGRQLIKGKNLRFQGITSRNRQLSDRFSKIDHENLIAALRGVDSVKADRLDIQTALFFGFSHGGLKGAFAMVYKTGGQRPETKTRRHAAFDQNHTATDMGHDNGHNRQRVVPLYEITGGTGVFLVALEELDDQTGCT